MDRLGTLGIFVHAAEGGSFVAASRRLGISSSAVGKAVARLEQEMGVRLFHRSTRSMTLTEEGSYFLDTCRRVLSELDTVQSELSRLHAAPRGILRVSLPLTGILLMPTVSAFMRAYPEITMDLDFTDRLVDVIEEGFDAVVRTGEVRDTRLMSRKLGVFRHRIVASPGYIETWGRPEAPQDLLDHRCLHHRYPSTGKLEPWPLAAKEGNARLALPVAVTASTLEPIIYLAEDGFGIACLPPFTIKPQLDDGRLVTLLDDHIVQTGTFRVLWPTSRFLSPKIRAFVDFMADNLVADGSAPAFATAASTAKP
ncbi:LysR family transcriptional regulator [Neorhizobium sp. DT-125]|uniref:LysR family transcriptional regulator n=1 Tax=Neorhizobium sp. DT-125 TaxID=3396163 RepID=UPI003F1B028A